MIGISGWLYQHAAKVIGLAVGVAVAMFGVGVAFPPARQIAFKGAELCVWSAGLFSVLLIRRQLWIQEQQATQTLEQLKIDHQWKTYESYHRHFANVPDRPTRDKLIDRLKQLGLIPCFKHRGSPIDDDQVRLICECPEVFDDIKASLDCFEAFCGAINAKLVDEDYAFSLQATRVVRHHTVFAPLIAELHKGSPSAYVELTKVATRWSIRQRATEGRMVEGMGIGGNHGAATLNGPN